MSPNASVRRLTRLGLDWALRHSAKSPHHQTPRQELFLHVNVGFRSACALFPRLDKTYDIGMGINRANSSTDRNSILWEPAERPGFSPDFSPFAISHIFR